MSQTPCVIGFGMSPWGSEWDLTTRDLIARAALASVQDAGIKMKDIEAIHIGAMSTGLFTGQENLGAYAADAMGNTRILDAASGARLDSLDTTKLPMKLMTLRK